MSKASKIVDLPKIDPETFEKKDESPTQLPVPKGWRMLIAIPEVMRSYSGTRFLVHGKEFRLINDDTVQAVVDDPRGYSRT